MPDSVQADHLWDFVYLSVGGIFMEKNILVLGPVDYVQIVNYYIEDSLKEFVVLLHSLHHLQ